MTNILDIQNLKTYFHTEAGIVKAIDGITSIIDNIDPSKFDVKILKPQDRFEKEWGTLKINFVKVKRKTL